MHNRLKIMKRTAALLLSISGLAGCATITNDAYVPIAISFSDGSSGECKITNKRMSIVAQIPSTPMVRRSDDNLTLDCTTEDGKTAVASVPGTIGAKIIASAVFIDLGIIDSITDKHREYPASYVVPVQTKK